MDHALIIRIALELRVSLHHIVQLYLHSFKLLGETLELDSSSLDAQRNLAVIHVLFHLINLDFLLLERRADLLHVNRNLFKILNFLFERNNIFSITLHRLLALLHFLILQVELLDELAQVVLDLLQ